MSRPNSAEHLSAGVFLFIYSAVFPVLCGGALRTWEERELSVIASTPVGFCHKSVGVVFLSYQASASRSAWKVHLFSGCVATDVDTVKMACVVIL